MVDWLIGWCRKHYELGEFVPRSLLSSVERSCRGGLLTCQTSYNEQRSLRCRLSQLINETRCARNKAGKPLSSLQIKLCYLRIISQLPSYGTRCFLVRTVTYYVVTRKLSCRKVDRPRDAPYMGALKIFGCPWLRPRPLFPKILMGFCSDWARNCAYKIGSL